MPGLPLMDSQPSKVESYTSEHHFPKGLIVIVIIILVVLGLAIYFGLNYKNTGSFFPSSNTNQNPAAQNTTPTPPAVGVIAKVGDELIYQRELDIELSAYPPSLPIEQRKALLIQKIATDSAILQGAQADGLITLDPTIFNSPNVDYLKRLKTLDTIQSDLSNQVNRLAGTLISIWFYNYGQAGSIGYDKGKEVALQKITKLQSDVKSGKITADQAAELIRDDTSLLQLDKQYKTNAQHDFDITVASGNYDKDLFNKLYKLNKDDTSDVFLQTEGGFDKPGYYQFAYITEKISNGKISNVTDWINDQIKKYETTVY